MRILRSVRITGQARAQTGGLLFTLVELLVGITLLGVAMSTIGMGVFRALGTKSGAVDDGLAINELREGFSRHRPRSR